VHRLRADWSPLSTGALHGRLERVTIPDAVKYNFDLLKMSIVLLEHVEVFHVIHILQNNGIVHKVGNKSKFMVRTI
jgi:protein associated with RNAse G/E